MEITFKLNQYIECLEPHINQSLDLSTVMSPFEMHCPSVKSEFLLHGHFCDWLNSQYKPEDRLMVFDILEQLAFLGFDPANQMVEKLHFLIQRQVDMGEFDATA